MKKKVSVLLICAMFFYSITSFAVYDDTMFADLGHYLGSGYLSVKNLVNKGIVSGKTETTFAPNEPVTREEAAKIIVLASGSPLVSSGGSFADVVKGEWYEVYVETAHKTGLMMGISSENFGVGTHITRQDAAVLVMRMAEYKGINIEKVNETKITDTDNISEYALSAVVSLVKMNVAEVDASGKYNPQNAITRLGFCKMVDRLLISDNNYYDDYLSDWIPRDIDLENIDSEILAFEDFENGLTVLDGYEESIKGAGDANDYIINDSGKESESSLKLTGDGDGYAKIDLFLREIEPGADYIFSYDIKTDSLGDAFARVNYEWYNASGPISGLYERNNDISGDNGWINQTAMITAPTPDTSPKFLRIAISIRGVTQGSVQIDNFKIYKMVYEPLTTYLKKPAYKGVITEPPGEDDIRLTSYIKGLGSMYNADDYHLKVQILDFDGKSYALSELSEISSEMDITFSSKILNIGDYDLSVKLIETKTGKVVGENHWILRKREEDFMTKYSFDEYGRMLKDGDPYFAIGSYAIGITESDIEDFKDTPIDFMVANSLSNYWTNNSLFEKMAQHGISSIMSTESVYKDSIRGQFQNKDVTTIASERAILERMIDDLNLVSEEAHMGYQINNESSAAKWAQRISWHNQILSEIDLNHITYGVGAGGKSAAIAYARCHDIYASDAYPITGAETDEIWQVYENTKGLAEAAEGRPVWAVVQISDLKVMGGSYASRERGPTENELRNMAWQAVCAGAQGIVWYAHFHLDSDGVSRPKSETFPEVVRVSEELKEYSNVIMSVEDAPDVRIISEEPSKFAHLVRRYNGKTYVFMVNMSGEEQKISLSLDGADTVYGAYCAKNYTVGNGGKLDVSLSGLGTEILIVDQIDQPSPDCELKNIKFYNGEESYFIVKEDDTSTIYIPNDINEFYYNVDIHPDARIIVNGCPNNTYGVIPIDDTGKVRFTVISEDGQHWEQHWYNIVKTE